MAKFSAISDLLTKAYINAWLPILFSLSDVSDVALITKEVILKLLLIYLVQLNIYSNMLVRNRLLGLVSLIFQQIN